MSFIAALGPSQPISCKRAWAQPNSSSLARGEEEKQRTQLGCFGPVLLTANEEIKPSAFCVWACLFFKCLDIARPAQTCKRHFGSVYKLRFSIPFFSLRSNRSVLVVHLVVQVTNIYYSVPNTIIPIFKALLTSCYRIFMTIHAYDLCSVLCFN